MLVIKCKCGCSAILKDDYLKKISYHSCPYCENVLKLTSQASIGAVSNVLSKDGFTIVSIPDNTKLQFDFDLDIQPFQS